MARTLDPFAALWILLLSTSAGAHAVVATVPAIREASACVRISSCSRVRERMARFATAYLRITSAHDNIRTHQQEIPTARSGRHLHIIRKHTTTLQETQPGMGGRTSLTHENTPNNIRRQPPPKHPDPFFATDPIQPRHGVRVAEALGGRLGGVGAHAHEDDLLSRLADETNTTRC